MANSLNRDIEPGEVLVLRRSAVQIKYDAPEDRLFIVRGGFGMRESAMGGAIIGEFACFKNSRLVPQGSTRINGGYISKSETESWQNEHGKFETEYEKGEG